MFDVVAIGELLIDFTPSGIAENGMPLFTQNPGGGAPNMLTMNASLGGKTAFIGKVGDDSFGHFLRDTLNQYSINSDGLVLSDTVCTTLAFVHLAPSGERNFSFHRKPGADMMLDLVEVDMDIIDSGKIIHISGLNLTDEPSRGTSHSILERIKDTDKIVSFDPNYRAPLWSSPELAKKEILQVVPSADILKVSDEELELLTGSSDLEKGGKFFSDMGPALVLISLGEKGAYFYTKNHQGLLPTYSVKTIDTTGAGDAFLGSILFKLSGLSKEQLENLSAAELTDIVDFGNAAGSLTTTKKGGMPAMPTMEEIVKFKSEHQKIQ